MRTRPLTRLALAIGEVLHVRLFAFMARTGLVALVAPTGTFQTYQAVGNREDLSNLIFRIAPTDTPFMSGIEKVGADAVYHEWQTQDLATAANNAQIEGDDTTFVAATPTVRLGNRCQISSKNAVVSGTQETVKKAGRSSEMNYQKALKSMELKRDMEVGLTQNTTAVTGSSTTARQLRGLEGWVATNNDLGATGAAPNYNTNTAPTDGTARAFTEAQLKNVLQLCWVQGGKPNVIMLGGTQTQTFSTFTGNATRQDKSEDKRVVAATQFYVSDFGTIEVRPNRFQRARTAFILQMDMWKLAVLRPFRTKPLAATGDSEKVLIITEYTLEARQEKSSGAVRDLL